MSNFQLFLHLSLLCATSIIASDSNTLKSVSVIFRHGDQSPKGFYPNDPYLQYSFGYLGTGGLTNAGKRREFELGTSLRQRYDEFLGKTYEPSDISVISGDEQRTKMSLLLVLAGLYPPKGQQIWKSELDWQPIPVRSTVRVFPSIFEYKTCPKYQEYSRKVKSSEEYRRDLSRFDELRKNLTELTGQDMKDMQKIYYLFHSLAAEEAMGLSLPKWTEDYYPQKMLNAVMFQYKTYSYDETMIKLGGGLLVRKILDDWSVNKATKRKLNLYSFHGNNIAAVMHSLGIWKNAIPEFSCAIVLELHEINGKPFIKILYYKGIPAEFQEETVPGCTEYCPVENFVELRREFVPDDVIEACFGSVSESLLIPASANPVEWIYNKIRDMFN